MDNKWQIFVSYYYAEGSGLFCSSIEVKIAPRDMVNVIVYEDSLHYKIYLYDKNLYLLIKKVSKVLEDTNQHIEFLRISIDNIPENKIYEFWEITNTIYIKNIYKKGEHLSWKE